MRAALSQISEPSVKPHGSRPAARQIVKMATGIRLNLNTACATADMREVYLNIDEMGLFLMTPITDRSSRMVISGLNGLRLRFPTEAEACCGFSAMRGFIKRE